MKGHWLVTEALEGEGRQRTWLRIQFLRVIILSIYQVLKSPRRQVSGYTSEGLSRLG